VVVMVCLTRIERDEINGHDVFRTPYMKYGAVLS
jgi:hypothetical protein